MLDGKPVNGDYALGLGGYLDIGIMDTMKDLLVNFVGAVIFSVIGFFYIKSRGKGNFAKKFIPQIQHNDIKQNEEISTEKQSMEDNLRKDC